MLIHNIRDAHRCHVHRVSFFTFLGVCGRNDDDDGGNDRRIYALHNLLLISLLLLRLSVKLISELSRCCVLFFRFRTGMSRTYEYWVSDRLDRIVHGAHLSWLSSRNLVWHKYWISFVNANNWFICVLFSMSPHCHIADLSREFVCMFVGSWHRKSGKTKQINLNSQWFRYFLGDFHFLFFSLSSLTTKNKKNDSSETVGASIMSINVYNWRQKQLSTWSECNVFFIFGVRVVITWKCLCWLYHPSHRIAYTQCVCRHAMDSQYALTMKMRTQFTKNQKKKQKKAKWLKTTH